MNINIIGQCNDRGNVEYHCQKQIERNGKDKNIHDDFVGMIVIVIVVVVVIIVVIVGISSGCKQQSYQKAETSCWW